VGARFSAPVQAGLVAHPASHTMGTGCCPGVQRPERDDPRPIRRRGQRKSRAKPLLLWAFVFCCRVNFTYCIAVYLPEKLKKRKQICFVIAEIHFAVPGGSTTPPLSFQLHHAVHIFVCTVGFARAIECWNTHLECCQIENTQYSRQSKKKKYMAGTMTHRPPAR